MSGQQWGYSAVNGPEVWGDLFPLARGKRQSPIDISTQSTTKGSELAEPLQIKYVPENTRSLVNPGYCWRVDVNGKDSELTGGPLGGDKYVLEQFHAHWGSDDDKGSEHTVDGQSYAGELHLVHWNQTKYESFAEAARHPDGLAVLGVFIKAGENPHEEFGKIVNLLPFVSHKNDRVTIPGPLDPMSLLPENKAYWTYLGSLTTPPFLESVIWIVFKSPIELSNEQLTQFRKLRCYDVCEECPCDELGGLVINNYRPPLPVGGREIREAGGH